MSSNAQVFFGRRDALVLLACASLLLSGCSGPWWSPDITARVVSKDGSPIEGAIVLLRWSPASFEGAETESVAVLDARTDSEGRFKINRWGPKFRSIFEYMGADQPVAYIFKDGFDPIYLYNERYIQGWRSKHRIQWLYDGKTLALQKHEGDMASYAAVLDDFWRRLGPDMVFRRCNWSKAPALFEALGRLKIVFDERSVPSNLLRTDQLWECIGTGAGYRGYQEGK